MKKYIFLFNSKFETIVSAKNGGSSINIDQYNILFNLVKNGIEIRKNKSLYGLNVGCLQVDFKFIENELKKLLEERELSQPSDEKSDWNTRFSKEQMFQSKKIFGMNYNLFKGGIDYKIFWYACLYEFLEYSINNNSKVYVYFNERIIDLERLQKLLLQLEKRNASQ
jgi:hypothetical protein